MAKVHKVVMWGPGQMGVGALRAIIRHPGLELVGLVVHSEAKEGRDAGELCGMPATGIKATRDIKAALRIEADAVAYFASGDFRLPDAAGDVAECLRAGRNVVTTSLVPMCYPPAADPDMRTMLETAALEGNSSLFTSGVDPGWANDLMALGLSAASERIESITMQEIVDYGGIPQPDVMCDWMGFGRPGDAEIPMLQPGNLQKLWGPIIHMLADAHNLKLDDVEEFSERWIADEAYEVAVGPIAVGTLGALRFGVRGIAGGKARIIIEHVTRMGRHSAPDWLRHPSPHGGYRIIVDGMPTYTIDLEIHGRGNKYRGLTFATVMRPINAIPAVIAAKPGVYSTLNMPVVTGWMEGTEWKGYVGAP